MIRTLLILLCSSLWFTAPVLSQLIDENEFEKYVERLDYGVYSYQVKKNWDLADSLETNFELTDFQKARLGFYKGVAILELGLENDGLAKLNAALGVFSNHPEQYKYWILRTEIMQNFIGLITTVRLGFDKSMVKKKVRLFENRYPTKIREINHYRLRLYNHFYKSGQSESDSIVTILKTSESENQLFRGNLDLFIGESFTRKGDLSSGIDYLLSAREILIGLKLQNSLLYAYLHRPLSAYFYDKGSFSKARYFFTIQKEVSSNNQITKYKNLVYCNAVVNLAGIYKEEENFESSLGFFRAVQSNLYPDSPDSIVNLGYDHLTNNYIANIYLELGELDNALWLIQQSIKHFEIEEKSNGPNKIHQTRAFYYSSLAKYHLLTNDSKAAIIVLQSYVNILEDLGIYDYKYSPFVFNVLAESYLVAGNQTRSKKYLNFAITSNHINEVYSNYQELFKSYLLLTKLFIIQNDTDGILVLIQEIQNKSLNFLNEYETFSERKHLFKFVEDWCHVIYPYLIDVKEQQESLDFFHHIVEFHKGIGQFQKSITNQQTSQANNLDTEGLKNFILKEEIFGLEKERKRLGSNASIELQIDSLENELMELGVSLNNKDSISFISKPLIEIQKNLNNDQFVNFFKSTNKIYAITADKQDKQLVDLGDISMIENCIDSLRSSLYDYYLSCASNRKDLDFYKEKFERNSRELYRLIIEPLAIKSHIDRLTISPIDKLNFIPFEVLMSSGANADNKFLLEKYAINYVPCISLLEVNDRAIDNDKVVLFAPKFEPLQDTFCVSEEYRTNYLGPIFYNKQEVDNIEKSVGGEILVANATLDNFIQKANQANVIHLATHGKVDFTDDNFSFLAFMPDLDSQEHKLYLKDLEFSSIDANCVVLSACESGLGKVYLGEGVKSMASSFLSAGAKSVISTLWSVNDRSTAMVMEYFYKHLKEGLQKDVALQQAKLDYLAKVDPEYRHPFYWAGFVAIGDMSPLKFHQNRNYLWLLLLIPLGVMAWKQNWLKQAS